MNKETTEVSMMTTWDKLKEEILNAPRWYVNIDMYDLKSFEGDGAEGIIVIEAETTDRSENRLNAITESLIAQIKGFNVPQKAMIYIQFPKSSPLIMEELNAVHNLVEETIPTNSDCQIMWGMSLREDDLSRVVCAIIPNKQ